MAKRHPSEYRRTTLKELTEEPFLVRFGSICVRVRTDDPSVAGQVRAYVERLKGTLHGSYEERKELLSFIAGYAIASGTDFNKRWEDEGLGLMPALYQSIREIE